MPNPDIVSPEIAERLREAGWPQAFAIGGWYMRNGRGPLLCRTLQPYSTDEILLLPSRRDLELALKEMGLVRQTLIRYPTGKYMFKCEREDYSGGSFTVFPMPDTPADAVALAYLQAKRREHQEKESEAERWSGAEEVGMRREQDAR